MPNKSMKRTILPRLQPGQALVEVAILLPMMLLLVLGAVDFGRFYYAKIVLKNAAREGASYLAYHPEDANGGYTDTLAAIINEADSSGVTVVAGDVTFTDCCTRGLPVGVTITQSTDLMFDGFLKAVGLVGGPIVVTNTVRMVVQ